MRILIFLFLVLFSSRAVYGYEVKGSSWAKGSEESSLKILEQRADRVLDYCKVGLSREQLIKAFYIIEEGERKGIKLFSSQETLLPCVIEGSELLQGYLIHSIHHKDAFIGGGYHKKVSKVILYGSSPKVLAECHVDASSKAEIAVLELLQGSEGIVPYYGCTLREKARLMYLEFFPQKSFGRRLDRKQPLTEEQVFKLSLDLSKGVWALHQKGLVHRDLHEGNVLLDVSPQACRAVLIDFGLTLKPDQIRDLRLQGSLFKSPPEGLIVNLPEIDKYKVDVYALGCLFYQMLFGKHPSWASVYNIYILHSYSQAERLKLYSCIVSLYQASNEQDTHAIIQKAQRGVPLTAIEKFTLLMYEMIAYDPIKRPSIERVVFRLENLQQ